MTDALIIFIKNPVKGKVKTRLARTVGDDNALNIYLQLLAITRTLAENGENIKRYLFYSDFIDTDDDWSNTVFEKKLQTGNDLGERMLNAFREVSAQHQNVIIIGSDCPTITTKILKDAFRALETDDYVLGPSFDGGYYLLGIENKRNGIAESFFLFNNMAWSTDKVFPETVKRIKAFNKKLVLLPTLNDIDDDEDWEHYKKS